MKKNIFKYSNLLAIALVIFFVMQTICYFSLKTTSIYINIFYYTSTIILFCSMALVLYIKAYFKKIVKKFNKVLNSAHVQAFETPISNPLYDFDDLVKELNEIIRNISNQQYNLLEQMQLKTKQYEYVKLDAENACIAKTQFLTNMSHEIRTPLNGISTVADLLVETNLDKEQKELVAILQNSSDNLLELVNDIFDFSCIESGFSVLEKNSFNLREMLDNYLTQFSLKAHEKGLEIILDIATNVPVNLVGDVVKLKRVISNILGNAVKFTLKGEIYFKIEKLNQIDSVVMLQFTISDSGVGISKEKMEHIFDSFTQGDSTRTRQFGGTGLGTTIAKELCNIMKGDIKAESPNPMLIDTIYEDDPETKGSVFTFTAEFDLPAEQQNLPHFKRFDPSSKRILVVDDNPKAAHSLEVMLVSFGFQVVTVNSAKHALQAVKTDGNKKYDVMMIDTFMPEENGFSLAEKLIELKTDAKIIFVSTLGGKSELSKANNLGLKYFLAKPVQYSKLFDVLQLAMYSEELSAKQAKEKTKQIARLLKGESIKILLVEDNPVNQWVALQVFKRFGYNPEVAENGKIAVEKHVLKNYDVIFMDIEMPVMDGLAATKKIRELDKNVKIIAMTANALKGDKEQCLQVGMDDYISKPININDLKAKLEYYSTGEGKKPLSKKIPLPVSKPVFLKQKALELVGDDAESLKEVLSAFVGFSTELIADLKLDVEADEVNSNDIRQKAHSLKGSSANLSMPLLKKAAFDLEQAAKNNETDLYSIIFNTIQTEFRKVKKEIKPYLEEN